MSSDKASQKIQNTPSSKNYKYQTTSNNIEGLLTKAKAKLRRKDAEEALKNGMDVIDLITLAERFLTVQHQDAAQPGVFLLEQVKEKYREMESLKQEILEENTHLKRENENQKEKSELEINKENFSEKNEEISQLKQELEEITRKFEESKKLEEQASDLNKILKQQIAKHLEQKENHIPNPSDMENLELIRTMGIQIDELQKDLALTKNRLIEQINAYNFTKEHYEYNLNELQQKNTQINLFHNMYATLKETIEENKQLLIQAQAYKEKTSNETTNIKSYAEVTGHTPQIPLHKSALLIKKKAEISTNDLRTALYKELKEDQDISVISQINCFLARDKETLVIKTSEEELLCKLSDKIQASKTIKKIAEISIKTENTKKVIILGIPIEMDETEILNKITLTLNKKSDPTVFKKLSREGSKFYQLVLELENNEAQQLLSKGRLLLRFHTCRVAPYVPIIRCNNCQWYGHSASHCRYTTTCPACGGQHTFEKCKIKTVPAKHTCVNCSSRKIKNRQHMASSSECQVYREFLSNRNQTNNYQSRST